jgi:hypothetical protein
MVFKLVTAAAKTWRRLKGENQLPKVVQGVTFTNGVEVCRWRRESASKRRVWSPVILERGHGDFVVGVMEARH